MAVHKKHQLRNCSINSTVVSTVHKEYVMRGCLLTRALVVICLFLGGSPVYSEPDAFFLKATQTLNEDNSAYAFTVATDDGEELVVESFDPSRNADQQWRLISVDDKAPSEKRISKYVKQKEQQRVAAEESGDTEGGFLQFVNMATVERVQDSDKEVTYHFQPLVIAEKPEFNEKFVGEVVIDKQNAKVLKIGFENTEKVKPAAVASLKKMSVDVEFQTLPDGQQVPIKMVSRTQGTVLVFKKINQTVIQEFSDYRKVVSKVSSGG